MYAGKLFLNVYWKSLNVCAHEMIDSFSRHTCVGILVMVAPLHFAFEDLKS